MRKFLRTCTGAVPDSCNQQKMQVHFLVILVVIFLLVARIELLDEKDPTDEMEPSDDDDMMGVLRYVQATCRSGVHSKSWKVLSNYSPRQFRSLTTHQHGNFSVVGTYSTCYHVLSA
jgi:hypothetical protein